MNGKKIEMMGSAPSVSGDTFDATFDAVNVWVFSFIQSVYLNFRVGISDFFSLLPCSSFCAPKMKLPLRPFPITT